MIFVINNLKYDTDKMELISDKCKWNYTHVTSILRGITLYRKDAKLYKSEKNNWLLTYTAGYDVVNAIALDENKVKSLLLNYDLDVYEKLFGELEEA